MRTVIPKPFGRWMPCTAIDQIFMYLETQRDPISTKKLNTLKAMWKKYLAQVNGESLSLMYE
jgi:hypothetical protein